MEVSWIPKLVVESGRKISLFLKVKDLLEEVEERGVHKLYLGCIEYYQIICVQ